MSKYFLIAAGGIFFLLGALHAILTVSGRLDPADGDLITRMQASALRLSRSRTNVWNAWRGFNLSHALGLMVLGVVCGTMNAKPWLLSTVSAIYLVLALRFWFYVPATAIAIATACLLLASIV